MSVCVRVCVCYLNVATQLYVGQPITKLLLSAVLPSHTSSTQLAVHISHTHTLTFSLKWLADLRADMHTKCSMKTHRLA